MSIVTAAALLLLTAGADPATPSYGDAYRTHAATGRPMLVLVTADWCPACVTMKHGALKNLASNGKFKDVEYCIVDRDREGPLAFRLMQGTRIPQLILFEKSETGWKRMQLTGLQSETSIQSFVRPAIMRHAARMQKENTAQAEVTPVSNQK